MHDDDWVKFMQEFLPKLGYRWKGFRKVRKQVYKRISRRMRELDLSDLPSYRKYLESHKEEEKILDFLCNVTISRFYRDRVIFDRLENEILPSLADKAAQNSPAKVQCWSAGCCSGEEPYTLQVLWKLSVLPRIEKDIPLWIMATDRDLSLIERAKKVSDEINDEKGSSMGIQADVTDLHQVRAMVSSINETLGPVDILVNNTGVIRELRSGELKRTFFIDSDFEFWKKVTELNFIGCLNCSHSVLNSMIERRTGKI